MTINLQDIPMIVFGNLNMDFWIRNPRVIRSLRNNERRLGNAYKLYNFDFCCACDGDHLDNYTIPHYLWLLSYSCSY